jgi:hypothetical protein
MSSVVRAEERPKLFIGNWLLDIGESTLPRLPDYSGGNSASNRKRSSEDCPAGYLARNLESYPDCCSLNYLARSLEGNSASCLENCEESSSVSCSADRRDNRRRGSPASNLTSNWVDSLLSCSESNPEDSLAGYADGSLACSGC